MALFTDGPIASIEDLHGYDTQLLDVANTEGIDVTRKLAQAQEEIGVELKALLARVCSPVQIGNVVVTSPLRLWHVFRSLEMVYRDAFNSQLNDRYGGKRDEYHDLAKWAQERVIQSGLGMTGDPIPQASQPTVHTAAGSLADGTYYVAMAWVNAADEEGAASRPVKVTVSGSSFDVQHGEAPANAKGWHVYVGSSPSAMLRQNVAVLGLEATWRQPDVLATGRQAGPGQIPGFVLAAPRVIQRG
jgi:hypothetical protein